MIVDPDFPDHWKTQLVILQLGPSGPLGLIRLWAHCQLRRNDVFELTSSQLAAITRIPVEPKKAERALCEARYIAREGKTIHVLGWRERNAGLFANVANGKLGGRPKKDRADKANNNPLETHGKPIANPSPTDGEPRSNPRETDRVDREEESRENPPPPHTHVRASACERGSLSALSETWHFLLSVLGTKKRRAGREAEDALARQADSLPLDPDEMALLEWFYKLPPDELDVDLRSRYRDADRLAINLGAAIDRARAYARQHGGPLEKNTAPEKKTAAPDRWREAAELEFPGAELPETWDELCKMGAAVRDAILRRLQGGIAA